MSLTLAILFAVLGTAGWVALDVVRKQLAGRLEATHIVIVLTTGAIPAFAIWAAVSGATIPAPGYLGPALGVIALNVAANLLFMRALELSPLSLTIPFLSFTPVFTVLLASPLLGEWPRALQLAGVLAVVVGALVLGLSRGRGEGGGGGLGWILQEPGVRYILLVALCWASGMVLDKSALAYASVPVHALVVDAGIALCLLLWISLRGRLGALAEVTRHARTLGVGVLLAALAMAFQLLALKVLLVGVLETIKRALELVASVLIGRFVFAETLDATKLAGVLLMALGTAGVMLG